jgi:hypothetical protein
MVIVHVESLAELMVLMNFFYPLQLLLIYLVKISYQLP